MKHAPVLDDMVMRSHYLRESVDNDLGEIARNLTRKTGQNVTKSDLIRAAISQKVKQWAAMDNQVELILADLDLEPRRRRGQ